MQALPLADKVERALPYLERAGLVAERAGDDVVDRVRQVVEAAGDRIKVAGDVLDYEDFFLPDDELPYDDKAFDKRLRKPAEAERLLRGLRERLPEVEPFEPAALEEVLRRFVDDEGVKIGQVVHALRVALTGKAVGFGLFETLAILGRERALARIDRALARLVL